MKGIDPSCNTIDSGAASGISLVPDASGGSIKPRPAFFFWLFFVEVFFSFNFKISSLYGCQVKRKGEKKNKRKKKSGSPLG